MTKAINTGATSKQVREPTHELTVDELALVSGGSGGQLLSNLMQMMADIQKNIAGNIR